MARTPQAECAGWAGVMAERAAQVAYAPSRRSCNSRLRSCASSSRWQGHQAGVRMKGTWGQLWGSELCLYP